VTLVLQQILLIILKSLHIYFQEVQARINQANQLFEIEKTNADAETKFVESWDNCYKTFDALINKCSS